MPTFEYGPPAYRTAEQHASFTCGDDGRTLLAGNFYDLQHGSPGPFEAIDQATGTVTAGPPVTAFATGGDVVAATVAGRPDAVTLLALHGLTPIREVAADGPVTRLAAGGGTIAAAGDGHLLVIAAEAEHRLVLPAGTPSCAAVSPDGTLIAIGVDKGRGGNVLVVDVTTGALRHTLTGPRAPVTSLAVSATHDLVAAASGPRVLGWTPSDRKPRAAVLWSATKDTAVAGITPAGRVVASADKTEVVSIGSSVEWSAPAYGPVLVTGGRVLSTRFTEVREHDPATGAVGHVWTCEQTITELTGAAGTVAGSDLSARPLLFRDGEPTPADPCRGHTAKVNAISFDGDRIATAGQDRRICVWERDRSEPSHTIRAADRAGGVLLTGDTLVAGTGRRLGRWTLGEAEPHVTSEVLKDDVVAVELLRDRDVLLVGCENTRRTYGMFYLIDPRTLEIRQSARSDRVGGTVTYVPGAQTFAMTWATGRRIVDLVTLETVSEVSRFADGFARTDFTTPDQDLLVRVGRDSLEIAGKVTPLPAAVTATAAMSPRGAFATPHADAIRVWDLRAGRITHELPVPKAITAGADLHWSPDGDAIMVCYGSGLCVEARL